MKVGAMRRSGVGLELNGGGDPETRFLKTQRQTTPACKQVKNTGPVTPHDPGNFLAGKMAVIPTYNRKLDVLPVATKSAGFICRTEAVMRAFFLETRVRRRASRRTHGMPRRGR
jgi:hypothetical protein